MLTITLRPSPWFKPVLYLLHGLALLAVCLAALPAILPWLLAPVLVGHGYWLHGQGATVPLRDFVELRIGHEFCELAGTAGVTRTGLPRLLYRSAFLTVIRLLPEPAGETIDLLLWPDSLDAEDDRRLQCYLRENGPVRTG